MPVNNVNTKNHETDDVTKRNLPSIKKKDANPLRLALYFLITCIGTEQEKVRQDVTDYKLELKISVCMHVNFEFRILIVNFEF